MGTYITLALLATFICDNKVQELRPKCEEYFAKCYSENINKIEYEKYAPKYRSLLVFNTCGIRGGYIKE